jgi:hypothetical protein
MKIKALALQKFILCLFAFNVLADEFDLKIDTVVRLDFQTQLGKIYQIVSSPSVSPPVWTTEGVRIQGTGQRFNATFIIAGPGKVFRIEELVLGNGLVAAYSVFANANDNTTNHNNATVFGGTLTTNRFGIDESAYDLNGTSQYLSAPHRTYLNFPNDGNFTMSLWASFRNPENGGVFIAKDNGSGDQPKWIFGVGAVPDQPDGQRIYFHINGPPQWFATPLYTPPVNKWQHYLVRKSGAEYSFFINGNLISTSISTNSISSEITAPLTIGQAEGGGWFPGQIDDIKIYNRALLTSEIKALSEIPD